jgi:hypothetical protein
MIPGPKLILGETEYMVPPLPLGALKKHKDFLARAQRGDMDGNAMMEEGFEKMMDCVYLALKRNYPQLTEAELEQHLDMRNISDAFNKVMESAGFKEKPAGE